MVLKMSSNLNYVYLTRELSMPKYCTRVHILNKLDSVFWFTSIANLCRQYFVDFRRKGPKTKWTIYKLVSDKLKKFLSVGNTGILSVIFCLPLSSSVFVYCRLSLYVIVCHRLSSSVIICRLCLRSWLHQHM